EVQFGIGLLADVLARAIEPAQRLRQPTKAPQAQRLVLPRHSPAERLVDRSEQLTCALRSGHTLRVATLVEISHRNVRKFQPRVIPLAPLQVEAAQALQQSSCAGQKLGRMHAVPEHGSSGGGSRSELDPGCG